MCWNLITMITGSNKTEMVFHFQLSCKKKILFVKWLDETETCCIMKFLRLPISK